MKKTDWIKVIDTRTVNFQNQKIYGIYFKFKKLNVPLFKKIRGDKIEFHAFFRNSDLKRQDIEFLDLCQNFSLRAIKTEDIYGVNPDSTADGHRSTYLSLMVDTRSEFNGFTLSDLFIALQNFKISINS